jgi:hypothetical protein
VTAGRGVVDRPPQWRASPPAAPPGRRRLEAAGALSSVGESSWLTTSRSGVRVPQRPPRRTGREGAGQRGGGKAGDGRAAGRRGTSERRRRPGGSPEAASGRGRYPGRKPGPEMFRAEVWCGELGGLPLVPCHQGEGGWEAEVEGVWRRPGGFLSVAADLWERRGRYLPGLTSLTTLADKSRNASVLGDQLGYQSRRLFPSETTNGLMPRTRSIAARTSRSLPLP